MEKLKARHAGELLAVVRGNGQANPQSRARDCQVAKTDELIVGLESLSFNGDLECHLSCEGDYLDSEKHLVNGCPCCVRASAVAQLGDNDRRGHHPMAPFLNTGQGCPGLVTSPDMLNEKVGVD